MGREGVPLRSYQATLFMVHGSWIESNEQFPNEP
jgi:hypothetical protein